MRSPLSVPGRMGQRVLCDQLHCCHVYQRVLTEGEQPVVVAVAIAAADVVYELAADGLVVALSVELPVVAAGCEPTSCPEAPPASGSFVAKAAHGASAASVAAAAG